MHDTSHVHSADLVLQMARVLNKDMVQGPSLYCQSKAVRGGEGGGIYSCSGAQTCIRGPRFYKQMSPTVQLQNEERLLKGKQWKTNETFFYVSPIVKCLQSLLLLYYTYKSKN